MKGAQTKDIQAWGGLAVPSVMAAAHELKSPLVLLRQLSYQLEMSGTLNAEQLIIQQRSRLTAERSLRLVENITQTGRLDDALFSLEPLQVHSVWKGVVDEIRPLANQMDQQLKLNVPKQSLLVVAHKELLPAVLMGLCDNALMHNPSGSDVTLSAKRDQDTIVFSVRDKGPKLDSHAFKNLESRLGVAPQPLGARPGSSGLGLWIAGSFARAMSSTLSVTRHQQGGMTFSLHVPTSRQLSLL
ncbi:MAG: HAMP domain-containing sensor histidine kinase [Candidatus Saccharimonadales bacterium]